MEVDNAGGKDYTVGQQLTLGDGLDGWDSPATIEVASVDENGAITEVNLVDGGDFSGDDGHGTYNLNPVEATLLMKALDSTASRSAGPLTAAAKHNGAPQPEDTGMSAGAGITMAASASALLALVALVVTKRNQLTAPTATPTSDSIMSEITLRPNSGANLKLTGTTLTDLL